MPLIPAAGNRVADALQAEDRSKKAIVEHCRIMLLHRVLDARLGEAHRDLLDKVDGREMKGWACNTRKVGEAAGADMGKGTG